MALLAPCSSKAAESAAAFLATVLADDFNGDGSSRIHKTYFSDGKGEDTGDCQCSMSRAIYDLKEEPMTFVASWQISNIVMHSPRKAVIEGKFLVLARTEGRGWTAVENGVRKDTFRTIIPLSNSEIEIVTYHLEKFNGRWKLVDPPTPRVAIKPVILELKRYVALLEEITLRMPERQDLRNSLENASQQLNALNSIQAHQQIGY